MTRELLPVLGKRDRCFSPSLVETNDRDSADPFIELVAVNWKVLLIFGSLAKKIKNKKNKLPSVQLVAFTG